MWPDCDTSVTSATRVAVRCVSGGMRTLIIALAAVLVALTACGGGSDHSPGAAKVTSPSPPTYDQSTLDACKEADASAGGTRTAQAARADASRSDVPALRDIAKRYIGSEVGTPIDDAHALAAAAEVATWCLQHGVPPEG